MNMEVYILPFLLEMSSGFCYRSRKELKEPIIKTIKAGINKGYGVYSISFYCYIFFYICKLPRRPAEILAQSQNIPLALAKEKILIIMSV